MECCNLQNYFNSNFQNEDQQQLRRLQVFGGADPVSSPRCCHELTPIQDLVFTIYLNSLNSIQEHRRTNLTLGAVVAKNSKFSIALYTHHKIPARYVACQQQSAVSSQQHHRSTQHTSQFTAHTRGTRRAKTGDGKQKDRKEKNEEHKRKKKKRKKRWKRKFSSHTL